jgi:hypothetical protein
MQFAGKLLGLPCKDAVRRDGDDANLLSRPISEKDKDGKVTEQLALV